jgi:peptidoglycan/LPS O-acetylase OafA/YrhL
MVFFLVSGYIVPASLERKGSIRRFWVSRLFRIYPMCLVAVLVAVLLVTTNAIPANPLLLNDAVTHHPLLTGVGNATMLQDLLGVSNAIPVMWTLSYEMAFYLLLTALFVFGVHRRSAAIASGFALVAVTVGGAIPMVALSTGESATRRVVMVAVAVMAVGLGLVLSKRRALSIGGALLLAGLVVVLLTTNGRTTGWQTMLILATMFCGTAIYRADQGQTRWRTAGIACAVVLGSSLLVAPIWHRGSSVATIETWTTPWSWTTAVLGAWLTFAVARALHRRRMPKPLTLLGSISYSVYLTHTLLLTVILWWMTQLRVPMHVRYEALWSVIFIAVVLVASYLTYRLIELPGQALGKRFIDVATRNRSSAPPTASASDASLPPVPAPLP